MKRHLTIGLALLAVGVSVIWLGRWWIARSPTYQGKSLETWSMDLVYSPDAQRRNQAAVVIQSLGVRAVPGLIRQLRSQDAPLKARALALAPRLPPTWRRLVQRNLKPPEAASVRSAAARALGLIGADARTAVPSLARCLRDRQGSVRWDAAMALSRIGREAVPCLTEALGDRDPQVRGAAAGAISQMHLGAEAAIPALMTCLGDEDEQVRLAAGNGLAAIGKPALPALTEAVEDGRGLARQVAAAALVKVYPGSRFAEAPLLKMVLDEHASARQQAIDLLAFIRDTHAEVIEALTRALKDPALEVRLAAARALGQAGPSGEAAVAGLTEVLKDESPLMRQAAAQALGQIGAAARLALADLSRMASDHVEEVRTAVAEAQGKIESSLTNRSKSTGEGSPRP